MVMVFCAGNIDLFLVFRLFMGYGNNTVYITLFLSRCCEVVVLCHPIRPKTLNINASTIPKTPNPQYAAHSQFSQRI